MLASSIPVKFPIPWANSALPANIRPIPVPSQVSVQAGAASLTDGFPPINFNPVAAGGIPPFGKDFNGIINQMTAWLRWTQAGGAIPYDATFQTAIGGYPNGAIIASATTPGLVWTSTVDNNLTNPDAAGVGWVQYGGSAGDFKWRATSEVLPGWVKANALTIGDSSSNATQLASPTTAALFTWHWTNFSNTGAQLFNSAGTAIARGASAAADYAAHNAIATLDLKGTGIHDLDTMGGTATTRLAGVPVVLGGSTTPGSTLGEAIHQITQTESAQFAFTPSGGVTTAVPSGSVGISDPTHNHGFSYNNISGFIGGGGLLPTTGSEGFNSINFSLAAERKGSAALRAVIPLGLDSRNAPNVG